MSSVHNFPCPQCGAKVVFNPEAGKLKCDYCGWEDAIAETGEQIQEHSYEQYFNRDRTQLVTLSSTALEVSCQGCGATIIFEPPKTAGQCPFCASALVAQPQQSHPVIAPEGVIPFAIGRQEARKRLQAWLNKLWFAPKALKTLAQPEKLHGIYLPFWTYDAQTRSHYRGERGEYYYTTETYTTTNEDGETVTETREVQHTKWYSVSGRVSRYFDDIAIAATNLLDRDRLNALEPWHLPESLQVYNPSYLAGFEAQQPQLQLQEGFELAKETMAGEIRRDVKQDIGGDEQRIHHVSTQYSAITFKHILLPVWLTSYRYKDKQYQVTVNARTGEVQGDRPYSKTRITMTIVAGIVLFFIVFPLIVPLFPLLIPIAIVGAIAFFINRHFSSS
ncbi:MAG: hypothetical protein AB4290_10695 [Spirulina sp.]